PSTLSATSPLGTAIPCLAKSCFPWYSRRSMGVESWWPGRGAARTLPECHNPALSDGPALFEKHQLGDHRLLRHPHRLGKGHHRGSQERGCKRWLFLRGAAVPGSLLRGPGRSHGGLV